MEQASGKKAGAGRLRRLNEPQPVDLAVDLEGRPRAVEVRSRRRTVGRIEEIWRVEGEWWRERPVDRTYFRLQLDDGPTVVVYRDNVEAGWWMQRY